MMDAVSTTVAALGLDLATVMIWTVAAAFAAAAMWVPDANRRELARIAEAAGRDLAASQQDACRGRCTVAGLCDACYALAAARQTAKDRTRALAKASDGRVIAGQVLLSIPAMVVAATSGAADAGAALMVMLVLLGATASHARAHDLVNVLHQQIDVTAAMAPAT